MTPLSASISVFIFVVLSPSVPGLLSAVFRAVSREDAGASGLCVGAVVVDEVALRNFFTPSKIPAWFFSSSVTGLSDAPDCHGVAVACVVSGGNGVAGDAADVGGAGGFVVAAAAAVRVIFF